MPTGVEEAIAGGIGLVGWLSSLPDWVKYMVFLAGLSLDSGIEQLTGYGVIGSVMGFVVSKVFGLEGFSISSFQILIIAVIAPIAFWVLSHYQND